MLKKLKSIFIVDNEDESTPSPDTQKEPTSEAAPPDIKTKPTQAAASGKTVKPDGKFVNLLLKAIEENNLDGFDYLEFKQSVRSLEKVETEESKRYQSAFAMAGAMGLTKSKLFSSAKHYANILNTEEKKFAEAFNAQRQRQINERETKGKALAQSIQQKEQQIKKLQVEIEKEKKQLDSVEADITKSMAKVEATKEGFYAAYNKVLSQIKGDLDKINEFLK